MISPLAETVTSIVAVFVSSETVIVAVPADFDVIAIFASPLMATVATLLSEEVLLYRRDQELLQCFLSSHRLLQ